MRKLSTGGITTLIIGIALLIIGLGIFLSTFFSFSSTPFQSGHSLYGFEQAQSQMARTFGRAVIGVILSGAGGLMIKIGLGMTLVGHADKVAGWAGKLSQKFQEGINQSQNQCPKCHKHNNSSALYCDQCGYKLSQN